MSVCLSTLDQVLRDMAAAPAVSKNAAPARELRQLVEGVRQWVSSWANGGGSVDRCFGILTGEPGYGQRELFEALDDICAGSGIDVFHLKAYEDAAPPGLSGDLVRRLLHDARGERGADGEGTGTESSGGPAIPHDVFLELLKVTTTPGGPDHPDRLPDLSHEHNRLRLIDAVVRALLEAASDPLILILENLTAADGLSRDVFAHLIRMLCALKAKAGLPKLCVIVSARDDADVQSVLGTFREEVEGLTAFQIKGQGYSLNDLLPLARETLGEDLPGSVGEAILRRTGGSVRHVRWLYRCARVEFDQSENETGRAEQWKGLLELSFSALVRRCLARLSEEDRRLVSSLSILGRSVPARVVSGIVNRSGATEPPQAVAAPGAGETRRADSLEVLRAEGWVTFARDASRTEKEVSVADADIGRMVVDGISPQGRDALRERTARVLEREARQDPRWLPHVLRQCVLASAGLPEDATLRAAVRYLQFLACPLEAVSLLDEALLRRLASSPKDRTSWLRLYAGLLQEAGETRRALDVYRELSESTDDAELKAWCGRRIGDLKGGDAGQREERLGAYEEGLAALAESDTSLERLRLLCAIARAHLDGPRSDEARAAVERCLELIEKGGQVTRDECLETYRLAREVSPGAPLGTDVIEWALARCRPGTDTLGRFQTLCCLADFHRRQGHSQRLASCLREVVETARRSGSRALVAEAGWVLARAARKQDRGFSAMTQLRRSLDVFVELGDPRAAQRVRVLLLLFELELGKFSRAGRRAEAMGESWENTHETTQTPQNPAPGEEESRSSGVIPLIAVARRSLVEGDYEDAERAIGRGLADLDESTPLEVVLAASRTAAQVSLETGKLARAYEQYLEGLRGALDGRSTEGTAEALRGLCEFFLQGGAFATAIGVARGGLAVLRSRRSPCELPLRRLLGRLAVEVGDAPQAKREFERAVALSLLLDMPAETCRLYLDRGWERFQCGEFDAALCLAEHGAQIASRSRFEPLRAEFLHLIGTAENACPSSASSLSRAADALEEALAASRVRGMPRLEWEVLHAIASMQESRGESELAKEATSRADGIEAHVLGELPRMLRGVRWRCRAAVVNPGKRRSRLSACAG